MICQVTSSAPSPTDRQCLMSQVSSQFRISHSPLIQIHIGRKTDSHRSDSSLSHTLTPPPYSHTANSSAKSSSSLSPEHSENPEGNTVTSCRRMTDTMKSLSLSKNSLAFNVTLSHMADRPLVSMSHDCVLRVGGAKERRVDTAALRVFLNKSTRRVKGISRSFESNKEQLEVDLKDIKSAHRIIAADIDAKRLESLKKKVTSSISSTVPSSNISSNYCSSTPRPTHLLSSSIDVVTRVVDITSPSVPFEMTTTSATDS